MAAFEVVEPDMDAAREWAAGLLQRARQAGPIPCFGWPDWTALPAGDPRKPAAAITAGLTWLHQTRPEVIAARLREEQELLERVVAESWKAVACDLSEAADWSAIATSPTQQELARRRARPGPLAGRFDPDAAAVWVRTGTSTPADHPRAA